MTASDLQGRLLQRLGDDPNAGGYYSTREALLWLNAAQRLMVLLTLCLETSGTLTVAAATPFYSMLTIFPDWLLPLRIRTGAGVKLKPSRFSDLAAFDAAWSSSPGVPVRYALAGFDFLGIYQQPASTTGLTVTYARCPHQLVNPSDVPDVPTEFQPTLIDGAIPLMRAKEGGQEWRKVLPQWARFVDACASLGDYVRARNKEQGYDYMPVELRRFDQSALLMESVSAK